MRTLYQQVTRKPDADCPDTDKAANGSCNTIAGGPTIPGSGGVADVNVQGGTSGTSGAIREFTRWICRIGTTQEANDPFTGRNYFLEIKGAINGAGFTITPASLRTPGSSCQVLS